MSEYRIGYGEDIHRLVEGRPLVLSGVKIPYEKGLLGHSDADVVYHAVSDALLGALALGDIGGIPRVLDAGQCNDSYSLALIALKLKEVFGLDDVNQLPIAYNIAWYEQKAVIVLLALLSLGVKNIHLGPTLPAFLSPNVANVLVENFGIGGISTVEEDMKLFGI